LLYQVTWFHVLDVLVFDSIIYDQVYGELKSSHHHVNQAQSNWKFTFSIQLSRSDASALNINVLDQAVCL